MIDFSDSGAQLQVAQRYYFAALAVDPSNGAPYNQLASMVPAGRAEYGLEAAFFYLRGLNCGGKQGGNSIGFLAQKIGPVSGPKPAQNVI